MFPVGSAIFLHLTKRAVVRIAGPFLRPICKDQDDPVKLERRVYMCSLAFFKGIFYTTSSIVGYLIMRDSPVLPWYLGGNGSIDGIFRGMPYQKQCPFFLEYSLFQLGYVVEDFVNHLFFK
jgi:hypothetical protein